MPEEDIIELCALDMHPEDIALRESKVIADAKEAYDAVASLIDEEVNFVSVLKALNDIECKIWNGLLFLKFIQLVAPDVALREASANAEKNIRNFIVETSMRTDLFSRVKLLHDMKLELPTVEAQRYLDRLILDGKRNGLHLSKEVQAEVKELKKRMNELGILYLKNVSEANTVVEFLEEELVGLPQDFINSLSQSPDTKKRKVTMKYPHYFPIMEKCKNPETRKTLNIAFMNECAKENVPILEELGTLRHKHANLLEYPNHVAYRTELCHAKTKDAVEKFLLELNEKLQPMWKDEKAYLLELKAKECKELNLPFDGKLKSWDSAYYSYKVKELKYKVDQDKIKEYFPLETVTKAILDIYQELLGLKFTKIENAKVWYTGVELFKMEDASSSQLIGYFYLDMFPRDGKYTHYCVKEMRDPCIPADGIPKIPVVAMVCNFAPPLPGKPSLLEHQEVETFFHEFGHVVHMVCNRKEYAYFNTERIECDFVEAPSQMLENWCWEPEPLKRMSSHYINKNCLPDDLIDTLIKSRVSNVAYCNIRQIILALFDHKIHSQQKTNTTSLYQKLAIEMVGVEPAEGTNAGASFTHLAQEYDSLYYGYLWSEVFSMDMFYTRFKGENLMNPVMGELYRKKILEQCKPVAELLRDFLGRDPKQDAFLMSKGLKV